MDEHKYIFMPCVAGDHILFIPLEYRSEVIHIWCCNLFRQYTYYCNTVLQMKTQDILEN